MMSIGAALSACPPFSSYTPPYTSAKAAGSFDVGEEGSERRASATCRFVATTPRSSMTKPVPMISGNEGGCPLLERANLDPKATMQGEIERNVSMRILMVILNYIKKDHSVRVRAFVVGLTAIA